MAGRKWKPGDAHVEFRCEFCSALLGVGMVLDGGLAVSSPHVSDRTHIFRGWIVPPHETGLTYLTNVRACPKHNTVVGDIIDRQTGSMTTRIRVGWPDVSAAIDAYMTEGRVGVVRLKIPAPPGATITGTENYVRAIRGESRRGEPLHPMHNGDGTL